MVSKDKVRELIKDYSAEKFAAVVKLCCAPAIFADADKTVYDLYGLTKEEREIVEKACEKPVIEEEF